MLLIGDLYNIAADTATTESVVGDAVKEATDQVSIVGQYIQKLTDWCMSKLGSIVVAVIFMVVCFKLVKLLLRILRKSFERSKLDPSVAGFFISAVKIVLNVLIVLTAASIVGFQITSFITILGTAGVTLGLALQGSLSNLAGGLLILILKPFRVGDYIVENNTHCEGTVVSIDIFYTRLITFDNKSVVIPNGNISNTSLVNVTEHDMRRVDIPFSVAYDSDMEKVKRVTIETIKDVDGYLPDEQILFYIDEFADSGINMYVKFYATIEKFFDAKWDAMWKLKKAFDENDIEIPFNQMDVHMK
jgi:small conductance mechanosensitive channel